MKKIAVVLAGCGHQDGSEITEAVALIVSLSKAQAKVDFYAPNIQANVTDHIKRKSTEEQRSVMIESARISRGNIRDLKDLNVGQYDGLAIPGGSGASVNLNAVYSDIEKIILQFHKESKPIAAICIAPMLVAKVLGKFGVELTLGDDQKIISEVKKTGAQHVECPVNDYVTDRVHKVITTPAYMHDAKPHEVFEGIQKLTKEFIEMA